MGRKKEGSESTELAAAPQCKYYEATLATDASGDVTKGLEIDKRAAIDRRKKGDDVVICRPDPRENRREASSIEHAASGIGNVIHHAAHANSGPNALNHYQAINPPPCGPLLLRNQEPEGQVITMRFFTPDLFVAFNSQEDEVVDEALEKWEAARDDYRKHFAKIEKKLPKSFVKLCKTVSLHDSLVERTANAVRTIFEIDDQGEHSQAIISLMREHSEFDLIYLDLVKPTEWSKPVDSDRFSDEHVLWLYDEVGRTKDGDFTHEILFSNGCVVLVTFQGFKYVERPVISERLFDRAAV